MLNGRFGLKSFGLSYCKADGNIKLSCSNIIENKSNINARCFDTKLEYTGHIDNKTLLVSKINDVVYFDTKIITNIDKFRYKKFGFMKFGLGKSKNINTKMNMKIKISNNTYFNSNIDCYSYPSLIIQDIFEYIGHIDNKTLLISKVDDTVYFDTKIVADTDEPIHRKFGFMKFGLGKPSNQFKGYVDYISNIDNSSVSSLNICDKAEYKSYIDVFSMLILRIQDNINLLSMIDKYAFPSLRIYEAKLFNSYIDKYVFPSLRIYETKLFNSYIDKYVFPSLRIYETKLFNSCIDKYVFPSLRIYDRLKLYNLTIYGYIELVILIAQIVHLDVTLNKGDILVLDSNNFNLTINDQNMLHLHRGDWITLDRNLVDFKMQAESGNKIDGKIIYNERFF